MDNSNFTMQLLLLLLVSMTTTASLKCTDSILEEILDEVKEIKTQNHNLKKENEMLAADLADVKLKIPRQGLC